MQNKIAMPYYGRNFDREFDIVITSAEQLLTSYGHLSAAERKALAAANEARDAISRLSAKVNSGELDMFRS